MISTDLENALKQAQHGDYTARVDPGSLPDGSNGLGDMINSVLDSAEQEHQQRLWMETIYRQNPMPMVILDTDYRMIDLNPAYEALMQNTRDRLMQMQVPDYKIRHLYGDQTDQTFRERRRTQSELSITFKDGTTKIVEQYGEPITDDSGTVTAAFFVFKDITDQRADEEEVQSQMKKIEALQRRSEVIVQQNPMPILLLDTSFNILVTNEAYVTFSGISHDRLLSMNAREFKVLHQEGEGLKRVVQDLHRSYGVVTVELPSGVHIVEQYGIPIQSASGELKNILVVYNDITEQRKKEEEIQGLMEKSREDAEALAKSAEELGQSLSHMATGDLTATVAIGDGDPLEAVKTDFNEAISSVRDLISRVKDAVERVENNTQEASKGVTEIATTIERVAVNSTQSSDESQRQLERIEGVAREMSDLSASIEEIASTSSEVMESNDRAAQKGGDAQNLGKQAGSKMEAVEQIAEKSVEEINALNEKMQEISNIIKLITDISNQTNLLALNAAIEAARAGEHGRGFAVVAGEVRNLAGESKKATETIESLIRSIQQSSDETAESMRSAYTEITSGIGMVSQTLEALDEMVGEANEAAQGVREIARATDDQANATNRVMEAMEEATRMTKETLSRVEDVAALAEEVAASAQEIGSGTQEVATMTGDLRELIGTFRLE
ncbi:MAG: methyl-accepting chemotaxis protein [Methanomicrobiales archaeon]